jgi:acetolactate synthase-1/2/3 large subunit
MSKQMKPLLRVADLLIKALEAEGCEYMFAVPGEENLDVLDALKDSTIRLILTRHEQGAAFMAATYGRLTGKVGVCMATLGPGATNFVTPAAYAQLGGMPLLMITGQKPIKHSKQGRFQIVDVLRVMEPVTKLSRQIIHASGVAATVREAVRLAEEEKPGAVLLELPEDVAAEETRDYHFISAPVRNYAVPSEDQLEQAAQLIRNSKRPLVMLGAGANRHSVQQALEGFIATTGLAFFVTQMGKGVLDESSPLYLGTAALSQGDYLHCAIERADLIINVGHDVVEKPPFFMQDGGLQVLHINYKAAEIDTIYFPQQQLVGDVAASINGLSAKLADLKPDTDYYKRVAQQVLAHTQAGSHDDTFPLSPNRIVHSVREVMGKKDIIALDNGVYKIWFARNYPAYSPNTILLDNALATMGAGLPSAMLAALHYPEKRVMAVCGDGGFMMNSQELETSVRLGLNLVVMVINDGSYGMIRWKQEQIGFADWGLQYGNPDFVLYAQSYGAKALRASSAEPLPVTLEKAFGLGGVVLVDVPVDYSDNSKVLIHELANQVCML